MTVLAFPRRSRFCSSCGIEFTPLRPAHTLCRRCFAWHRIAAHISAVRVALEAAR